MINRLEITAKFSDARALLKRKRLESLGFKIKEVWLVDVYTIDKKLTRQHLKKAASVLTNPVFQTCYINKPYFPSNFSWAIEIGYLPGVTDNIASSAKEIIEDLLRIKFKQNENVYTSQLMFIDGNLGKDEVVKIADGLFNPLIQRVHIKNKAQFRKDKGMDRIAPQVKLDQKIKVDEINLNISDEELIKIGKMGITNKDGTRRGPLALDLTYMKTIQKYFQKLGRNPTDVEMESIAQTWSEHCKHTIFADPIDEIKRGLFKTYIKKATDEIRQKKGSGDFCVSVFEDNSGAIEFDHQYLITHKAETHNTPSALDPFGGSITGIVGVNRDAIGFGLGAKPIINTYGFCFARPQNKKSLYKGENFKQKMLPPLRIINGVIDGVNSGGNCSGIPTPQGFVIFDDRYQGKPLVFVGTVGLIPKKIGKKPAYVKKALPGDYIVMIGGRVGQDGIHGATFSSEAMDAGSPATAVQIGDPITQKKLSDAVVKEARDLEFYHSITDNGAGGLSCSVAEMAKESGGCLVDLEKVPLKYPGLEPWKIWISESQERMTLAVPKNKWEKFFNLMRRRGVEATIIGKFTNSGKCVVKYQGKTVMDVDMKFLHDGLPPRPMKTQEPLPREALAKWGNIPNKNNYSKLLLKMLARLNIAGFEFISQQYDHEVQGNSVLKPLQGRGRINSETTVVRPVLNSLKGVVISQGIIPQYSDIDTYSMAASSIDTAIRNAVAAGADINRLALLDNFCWCSSNEPEKLGQLRRAVEACYDCAIAYQTPFISGKDSMFNDFKGYDEKNKPLKISIPPTLLVSSIGILNDVKKTVSIDVKFPGDLIYVLGETKDEMGASEYFAFHKTIGNNPPKINVKKNKKLYQDFYKGVQADLIVSAISVNRGGLGIALAKTAMAGMLGIDISLKNLPGKFTRDDFALFSESQGRIVVTVNPKNKNRWEKLMKGNYALVGKVTDDNKITIRGKNNKAIVNVKINEALKNYKKTFKDY